MITSLQAVLVAEQHFTAKPRQVSLHYHLTSEIELQENFKHTYTAQPF